MEDQFIFNDTPQTAGPQRPGQDPLLGFTIMPNRPKDDGWSHDAEMAVAEPDPVMDIMKPIGDAAGSLTDGLFG